MKRFGLVLAAVALFFSLWPVPELLARETVCDQPVQFGETLVCP